MLAGLQPQKLLSKSAFLLQATAVIIPVAAMSELLQDILVYEQ